jgi:hypothetical protein
VDLSVWHAVSSIDVSPCNTQYIGLVNSTFQIQTSNQTPLRYASKHIYPVLKG